MCRALNVWNCTPSHWMKHDPSEGAAFRQLENTRLPMTQGRSATTAMWTMRTVSAQWVICCSSFYAGLS